MMSTIIIITPPPPPPPLKENKIGPTDRRSMLFIELDELRKNLENLGYDVTIVDK